MEVPSASYPKDVIRKLHIGGQEKKDGWEILNIQAGQFVDHVGDASDLSRFQDCTFDEIYASHILEHVDYKNTGIVLKEWKRVLVPGGRLFISVPDLFRLSSMFVTRSGDLRTDFSLMRIVFGGHIDPYDYHVAGFTERILSAMLDEAGFKKVERVQFLPQGFQDCSQMLLFGVPISLNMKAYKFDLE